VTELIEEDVGNGEYEIEYTTELGVCDAGVDVKIIVISVNEIYIEGCGAEEASCVVDEYVATGHALGFELVLRVDDDTGR
jgi:hypothetical protein